MESRFRAGPRLSELDVDDTSVRSGGRMPRKERKQKKT